MVAKYPPLISKLLLRVSFGNGSTRESCLSCPWGWGEEVTVHLARVSETYEDLGPELAIRGKNGCIAESLFCDNSIYFTR